MMELSINPYLDYSELADQFASRRYLQVRDVFAGENAEQLSRCLGQEVPWGLAYYDQGAQFLRAQELTGLTKDQRQSLQQQIFARARTTYQYAYSAYPMLQAYLERWNEVPVLNEFLEALNSAPMLEFVRAVTGIDEIIKADAQATRYGPGQFLRQHNDQSPPDETWLVAYVYNLTAEWQPDWGGYLQLIDEDGDIAKGFRPRYNALNLLAVPQPHLVSTVAPFAGAVRYSITGWFRSR